MIIDIYQTLGIIGLMFIIAGVMITKPKRRKKVQYPLFILGGICLTIYSIYIKDAIFVTLQVIYTLAALYGLFKIHKYAK